MRARRWASTSARCRWRRSPRPATATRPAHFDAVVLADVLEHLDDPVDAIDRCAELLKPGGVLCIVTPDPSSVTARLAGARWWGYLPGHTVLLPRKTLRELISRQRARDLRRRPVRAHVRGQALGRRARRAARAGVRPLGKAGGPAAAVLAQPLARRRARDPRPSHAVRFPAEPLLHSTNGRAPVHVVLPAYKAARTIPDVVDEMPVDAADRALLIDDASPDETANVALAPRPRRPPPSREPGLRRVAEDGLRAGAAATAPR